MATCYARSIELANTIIFQGAADTMHILALAMTIIMVLHVRSKFTAVGRKEITTFFYIYMLLTMVSLVLDAGVIPLSSGSIYPYFAAIQNGLTSALCTCLLINGFVGFQLYEDGTTLSVWLLRLASLGMFVISFAVSLLTFKGWAGLGPMNTTGLFVVLYLVNGIELLVYVVMQVILVLNTLQDRWPLGDILFGVFFFVIGQVILYTFSQRVCETVQHYLDGLFFATVCNLLAVMMVYKVCLLLQIPSLPPPERQISLHPPPFSVPPRLSTNPPPSGLTPSFSQYWDSITREDLEFSVGTKQNNWEVSKDPLFSSSDPLTTALDDRRANGFEESTEHGSRTSLYQQTQRGSLSQHRLSRGEGMGIAYLGGGGGYVGAREGGY